MISSDELLAAPERHAASARNVLILSALATLVLYNVPFLGRILARPLVLLSTVAHEMGHGLTALMLGGRFQKFQMWASGAGLTEVDLTGFGRVRQGLTLAGGLVGPSVAAAVCFFLGRTTQGARACLIGLGVFLLLVEIFLVRNVFGFVFVGLLVAACFLAARLPPDRAQLAVIFVGVQLALSVFSRADYLFTRGAVNPSGSFPSDVMQMQRLLFLPYWFWGALCGAVSVAVLVWGVALFWRK
ncbi:MAG TPA: M50 family metallopeptidase [Thermoanaerobaculia bacterium]|nr:M50 family metallopeptidase [Thermoanaerobaculia bacterium]